jgi:FKBP-type peptidyl-prolyl cis-trans isomerase
MKRLLGILTVTLVLLVSGCSRPGETTKAQTKLTFESEQQKESYSVGFRAGIRLYELVKVGDIEEDGTLQGILDGFNAKPQLSKKEMQKLYANFKNKQMKRREEREKIQAHRNKMMGEKFLSQNARKEGVVVTDSGLQYRVLTEGNGEIPKETDIAVVHYRGMLLDGTEIFNSYKNGKPIRLPVNRSLPAWKEALQKMRVGSKFVMFIPPQLAYKDHGKPPLIAGNTVLVYEAELLGIE